MSTDRPERGTTARCANCREPITYESFVGLGFWEPDIDEASYRPCWRHTSTGYTSCGIGMTSTFAEPSTAPEVVCLCGSTRFYDAFQQANYDLTMAGKIVLTVGFYPHSSAQGHGEGVGHDSAEKVALDELHKRKIDLADRVLVLNVGGYVGSSTASEIAYAEKHGVPVDYLEPVGVAV